jgi:magnesium chelatase family protein
MLAARLPTILPPLSPAELLEVSMIASVAGEIEDGALTNRGRSARRIIPPRCRRWSAAACAREPGEVSLAHHGVLFLDELPEFQPQALDSLRQPLETGEVAIARANHRVTYPARFMLVAAMNPAAAAAPRSGLPCRRGPNTRCAAEYQARLSGRCSTASISHRGAGGHRRRSDPAAAGRRQPRGRARVARARALQASATRRSGCRRQHQRRRAGALLEEWRGRTAPGCAAARRRRRHAAVGARLSPRAAGGAHARRSRRRGKSRPRASRRGAVLPRADGSDPRAA